MIDLKEDNLVLVDKEYILSDYEENEADIVYRANIDGKEVIFYIENILDIENLNEVEKYS